MNETTETPATTTPTESNIIFSYSWDDAINDGTFIRIDDKIVKEAGFKYPIAFTSNLYYSYIDKKNADINGRIWDVLWMMRHGKMDGNMCEFQVKLGMGNQIVNLWAFCEARSPSNPEPIITIMLPEDY